jgi:hypothetical protein
VLESTKGLLRFTGLKEESDHPLLHVSGLWFVVVVVVVFVVVVVVVAAAAAVVVVVVVVDDDGDDTMVGDK